jgi:hypothetical protein
MGLHRHPIWSKNRPRRVPLPDIQDENMARRPAGKGRSARASGKGSRSSSNGKKVYADDDLVIEEEEPAPRKKRRSSSKDDSGNRRKSTKSTKLTSTRSSSARSKSARSSQSKSTKASGRSSGRKRSRSDDEEPKDSRRRGRASAGKKGGNNNDMVVYLLTALGALVMITVGLVLMSGGGEDGADHTQVIDKAKILLTDASKLRKKWNDAERSGNEPERAKYIRLCYKKYEAVIKTVDTLRVPPYADKDEQFLPGYEFLENYSGEAGQVLHDITKRAKTSDRFE